MSLILLILVILLVCGGLPPLQTYHSLGYGPTGLGGVLLLVLLILLVTGRL